MSDFVSSVLDELVPTFSEEAGDWERVVADAGAETPTTTAQWSLDVAAASAAPRRRHGTLPGRWLTRRRLVAVAVAAVLAALLVTPALGLGDRLLSLIQGKQIRLDVQAPAWSPDGRTIVTTARSTPWTPTAARLGTSLRTQRRMSALRGRPTDGGSPS